MDIFPAPAPAPGHFPDIFWTFFWEAARKPQKAFWAIFFVIFLQFLVLILSRVNNIAMPA